MVQVIELTHSEKVKMYQTVEKDTLIEMLITANNVITRLTEANTFRIADVSSTYCSCQQSQCYLANGSYICATCNRVIGK